MAIAADNGWLIIRESNSVNFIRQIKNRGREGKTTGGSCSVAYIIA